MKYLIYKTRRFFKSTFWVWLVEHDTTVASNGGYVTVGCVSLNTRISYSLWLEEKFNSFARNYFDSLKT